MPIAFDQIPANILVPLFWAEIRPAFHPFNATPRILLLGHKNDNKGTALGSPTILTAAQARSSYGPGSQLEMMYNAARENNRFGEIWGIAVQHADGSVAATGSLKAANIPPRSGSMVIRIAGIPVAIGVRTTDTKAQVAARVRQRINATTGLPVTAALESGDDENVILTCKWVGASGNMIVIERSFYGQDEPLARQVLTQTNMSGGNGAPTLSPALATMVDQPFDVIVSAWSTTSVLNTLQDFMDGVGGRWSPYQQIYGHCVTADRASFGSLVNKGIARNDPHMSIMGCSGSPTPPWQWGAAFGAVMAAHFIAPPELSRPLHSLELRGVIAANAIENWFSIEERQALLEAGIACYQVDDDRTIRISREVTTYKTNVWGDLDASWRDAGTLFQAMYFTRYMRALITSTFPRAALTDQDSGIEGFASPGQIRDLIIHGYKQLEAAGLVENVNLFAQALVVERNIFDPNRVDVLVRPDMVNQLRVVAFLVETHLQLQGSFALSEVE